MRAVTRFTAMALLLLLAPAAAFAQAPPVQNYFYNDSGLRGDLAEAAREASDLTMPEFISRRVSPYGGVEAVCGSGLETFMPLGIDGERLPVVGTVRGRNPQCTPELFPDFACNPAFSAYRRERMNGEYASTVRRTFAAHMDDPALFSSPDQQRGAREVMSELESQGFDPGSGRCGEAPCPVSLGRAHGLMRESYRRPAFRRHMEAMLQTQVQDARGLFGRMQSDMVHTVLESLCPAAIDNTTIGDGGVISDFSAVRASCPSGGNAVEAMLRNVAAARFDLAPAEACVGDTDQMLTARQPNGSVMVYACPRALMTGEGGLDVTALQSQMATSIGHALDSCALESLSARTGEGADSVRSLAPLGDELRACLAENHLRIPALTAPFETGRTAATYATRDLAREMVGRSARDAILGADGSREARHCAPPLTAASAASLAGAGATRVPTNALEAQFWANRALMRAIASSSGATGVAMSADQTEHWNAFCEGTYAMDSGRVSSCRRLISGRTAATARFFNVMMAFQPYCRGLSPAGTRADASPAYMVRRLLVLAGQSSEVRAALGCTNASSAPAIACGAPPEVPEGVARGRRRAAERAREAEVARRGVFGAECRMPLPSAQPTRFRGRGTCRGTSGAARCVHPSAGECTPDLVTARLAESPTWRVPPMRDLGARYALGVIPESPRSPEPAVVAESAGEESRGSRRTIRVTTRTGGSDGVRGAEAARRPAADPETPDVETPPIEAPTEVAAGETPVVRPDEPNPSADDESEGGGEGDGTPADPVAPPSDPAAPPTTDLPADFASQPHAREAYALCVGAGRACDLPGAYRDIMNYINAIDPDCASRAGDAFFQCAAAVLALDEAALTRARETRTRVGTAPPPPPPREGAADAVPPVPVGVIPPREGGSSSSSVRIPVAARRMFSALRTSRAGAAIQAEHALLQELYDGDIRVACEEDAGCGAIVGLAPNGAPIRSFTGRAAREMCPRVFRRSGCQCTIRASDDRNSVRCDTSWGRGDLPLERRAARVAPRETEGSSASVEVAYPIGTVAADGGGRRRLYLPERCLRPAATCTATDLLVHADGQPLNSGWRPISAAEIARGGSLIPAFFQPAPGR